MRERERDTEREGEREREREGEKEREREGERGVWLPETTKSSEKRS